MSTSRRNLLLGSAFVVALVAATWLGVAYPRPPCYEMGVVALGSDFQAPVDIEGARTAVTPALTFQDDTDTGFYRPTTDTLRIATAGASQVEIDAAQLTITPPVNLLGSLALNVTTVTVDANGTTITPTSSYVSLYVTDTVTCTIADGSLAGQVLLLYNSGSHTATIDESDYKADTAGDVAFTTDDSLLLLWTGSLWTKIADLATN